MASFPGRFQNDILEVRHGVIVVSDSEGAVRSAIMVAVFGYVLGRTAYGLSEVGEHLLEVPSRISLTRPTVEVPSIPEDVYHPVDHRASPESLAPRPFTSFVFDTQTDAFLGLDLSIKSNRKIESDEENNVSVVNTLYRL